MGSSLLGLLSPPCSEELRSCHGNLSRSLWAHCLVPTRVCGGASPSPPGALSIPASHSRPSKVAAPAAAATAQKSGPSAPDWPARPALGAGAPSLAPCATALTQQRSGSVHVHLPPRCAPLRRADTPGGTPLNSPPPTVAPPAFKRIFPGPPRLSGWGPRRHFHQVPPVTFKCENTCHWAGTSMG